MMYKKIYRSMCFLSVVTLIFSVVMTLCACYTSFSGKLSREVKSEAMIIAKLIENSDNKADALRGTKDIFAQKRVVLFSKNGEVIYDNSAEGRISDFHEVKLSDGSVLKVASTSKAISPMFYSVMIAVIFISALIYVLTALVASRLTDNIIKPIERINSFDEESLENVYEEIQPFLKRIANQNREISHQTSKAKTQSARIRAIMDNINEGLIITDKDSEVLSVNDCALDIFQRAEADVKHKPFDTLTDNPKILAAESDALMGKKDSLYFESQGKTYQIFYSPVYEKGEISGAVMLLFDVSQKTETEKIRKEFTANVSHELKTPLTTIHGYAQIIDSGIAKPDDISGFVKKIEKESSRLITLVNDIIELSHLDEISAPPEMQSISLKSVAMEVAETLSDAAKKKNLNVEIKGEDTTVTANLPQLTEMVYNLADNAIKYNKDGGSVKIIIGEKSLKISDTGIGIPQKYYDRIFERFFRVDKSHSKKVNGTGLGLSIVKHLAKANNTEISVSSEVGEGTEFTLKFGN